MPKPHHLPSDLFATIVEHTPLISIDLIIRNSNREILLGRRLNAPARGFWFTPGGRIYKDETMAKKLLGQLDKLLHPIDLYTGDEQYINVYALRPRIVMPESQYCLESNLDDERV